MSADHMKPGWRLQQWSLILFAIFMAALWLGGGASRGDALGQAVVRGVAWLALAVAVLSPSRTDFRSCRPVGLLMLGAIALPIIQLVPLPQSVLPGFLPAQPFDGPVANSEAWRSIAISPGSTLNALFSLIVPMVMLILTVRLKPVDRAWTVNIVMLSIMASVFVGLLQFTGSAFSNPLINDLPGSISGNFANRNHFALMLAIGCLVVPVWAFNQRDQFRWRVSLAFCLILLMTLTMLASGSRAGIALGALSLILAPLIVREDVVRVLKDAPRWLMPTIIIVSIAAIIALVLASIGFGRAASIDRLTSVDIGDDMRGLGMPTVIEMIKATFPFGVGAGGFDAAFRVSEPSDILQLYYFNHAHNDWLELVLENGIFGLVLLALALFWWARASLRVWWHQRAARPTLIRGRLGSASIFLVLLASAVDYPARTPLVMSIMILAACWLAWGEREAREASSLRGDSRSL